MKTQPEPKARAGREATQRRAKHPNDKTPQRSVPALRWASVVIFCATIFLSAFLLFQVQPLMSKVILPWFGGSPAVWTTSMLFYQVLLFGGYCYVYFASRLQRPAAQAALHVLLIVAAIAFLPVFPADNWRPDGGAGEPTWHILALLAATVGPPFFLLSTTAPLLQDWWRRVAPGSPYRLYALSNAGSLLALLSYPFLLEPLLGTKLQSLVWSGAYVLYAVLLTVCGAVVWRRWSQGTIRADEQIGEENEAAPSWPRRMAWLALPATGSVLLLAMTNYLCQDVAVVPFLWVVPLALYLLSFILCFGSAAWYHRGIWGVLMAVTTYGCAVTFHWGVMQGFVVALAVHLSALFCACMVCHGELVRIKPAARYLTTFYLYVAAGGALGGVFVSLIAPRIFTEYYEYPFVMIACWLILMVVMLRDQDSLLARGRPVWAWALILVVFIAYGGLFSGGVVRRGVATFAPSRNFYGVLAVLGAPSSERPDKLWLELRHGLIKHGAQYLDDELRFEPTTYYTRTSGLGRAMQFLDERPQRRIGAVGLGVGTVAAYAKEADDFRFYEINPEVIRLASDPQTRLFTFLELLDLRKAHGSIVVGDARVSLQRELDNGGSRQFDLLVLDAFTGDAIPAHLLTVEAFEAYLKHLAPDGLMAVHVSNRLLDLRPLMRGTSEKLGLQRVHILDKSPDESEIISHWVLLGRDGTLDALLAEDDLGHETSDGRSVLWTDDFSNLFSVLR